MVLYTAWLRPCGRAGGQCQLTSNVLKYRPLLRQWSRCGVCTCTSERQMAVQHGQDKAGWQQRVFFHSDAGECTRSQRCQLAPHLNSPHRIYAAFTELFVNRETSFACVRDSLMSFFSLCQTSASSLTITAGCRAVRLLYQWLTSIKNLYEFGTAMSTIFVYEYCHVLSKREFEENNAVGLQTTPQNEKEFVY